MGAAQSVPVVGEVVTAVDSGYRVALGTVIGIVGELSDDDNLKKCADGLFDRVFESWVEYSERNIIAAPIRALCNDEAEADRIMRKCGNSVQELADNTPVIGHVKGAFHYVTGDTDHGNACMKGATRSLAVAGAGALTGGLGAGVVVGGMSGVTAGVAYDGVCTGIQSVANDKYTPSGSIATATAIIQEKDAGKFGNSVADLWLGVGGDFLTGAQSSEAARNARQARQAQQLRNKIGKQAAQDTMDAAKRLEAYKESGQVTGDNHVCTKVRNVKNNKQYYGMNKRARSQVNVKEFERRGAASGFPSKTQAKKAKVSNLKNLAEESGLKLEKKVGNRCHDSCAEHHAFEKFIEKEGPRTTSACTHSVVCKEGEYRAVERCGNCKQYGGLMGSVPTDAVAGMTVPLRNPVGKIIPGAVCVAALCVARNKCRGHSHRD